jgi:hypothetical protein
MGGGTKTTLSPSRVLGPDPPLLVKEGTNMDYPVSPLARGSPVADGIGVKKHY